jgi:hypothetical protein
VQSQEHETDLPLRGLWLAGKGDPGAQMGILEVPSVGCTGTREGLGSVSGCRQRGGAVGSRGGAPDRRSSVWLTSLHTGGGVSF